MMKSVIGIIALFSSALIWSQENVEIQSDSKFNLGIKIGANFAFVPEVLEEVKENHTKIRFNGGVFLDYSVNDHFSIVPMIEYSLKGTDALFILTDDTFPEGVDINAEFSLDYLSFPVLFRYQVYKRFYLGLGPYIAFMVKDKAHVYTPDYVFEQYNARIDTEGTLEETDRALEEIGYPLNVKINRTDLGLYFDIGYRFNNGLGINGSYAQGLRSIIEGRDESFKVSPKNQVFFLGLDYAFPKFK